MSQGINKIFFPHDNKPEHFKELDGLRGIAVIFVLLSHASNESLYFLPFLNFSGVGKIGVFLFFVLSAYLLDRQIAIAFMSGKSSPIYWKNYFLRRFLRIFPLFIIALFLYAVLSTYGYNTEIDFKNIWHHIVFLQGESVFWSIPVEFKYYFLSPLIIWVFNKYFHWNIKNIAILIAVLIVISIAIQIIFRFSTISTFRFLPIFLVGTLISIYELLNKEFFEKGISKQMYTFLTVASLGIIFVSIPYYFELITGRWMVFHNPVFYLPFAFVWGSLLLSSKYNKGVFSSFLRIKFLRFIGTISFSLYLFHMPVLLIVKDLGVIGSGFKIYIFFIFAILISALSFLIIERPLSKIKIYKHRLTEKEIKTAKAG